MMQSVLAVMRMFFVLVVDRSSSSSLETELQSFLKKVKTLNRSSRIIEGTILQSLIWPNVLPFVKGVQLMSWPNCRMLVTCTTPKRRLEIVDSFLQYLSFSSLSSIKFRNGCQNLLSGPICFNPQLLQISVSQSQKGLHVYLLFFKDRLIFLQGKFS